MSTDNLYLEFSTAYSLARMHVIQNAAKEARQYVIKCMSILAEMYKNSDSPINRARLYVKVCEFKKISVSLFECGVNDEVKLFFGINTNGISLNKEVKPVGEIEKIMVSSESQDWSADIFEKYKNSAVEINAVSNGNRFGGTGFIISENGYLLTNDHVIYDEVLCNYCKNISMKFLNSHDSCDLEIIDTDKKSDVALCRFKPESVGNVFAIPRIKDYSSVRQGEEIMIIGNPLSMGLAPVCGKIRYTHSSEGNLVYTALSNHGDSGGPVLNKRGECIGINKSMTVAVTRGNNVIETHGMANATPMDKIDELLKKWCKQYNIIL